MSDTGKYHLQMNGPQYVAYEALDGPRFFGSVVAAANSLEEIVRQCEEAGLQLYSVSDEVIDEVLEHVTRVEPAFDYFERTFPGHVYQPDEGPRNPLGFRLRKLSE